MSIHIVQQLCREYVEANRRPSAKAAARTPGEIIKKKRYFWQRKYVYNEYLNRQIKFYEVYENDVLISKDLKTIPQVEAFINERVRK